MKELRDTIQDMTSDDYKRRFVAESEQTKIRYEKLKAFNTGIEARMRALLSGDVPDPTSPYDALSDQQSAMGQYLHFLELRAPIEHIELN